MTAELHACPLPFESNLPRSTIWTCDCGKDHLVARDNKFIPLPKTKYQKA